MSIIATGYEEYMGEAVDNGQCVRLLQVVAPGIGHTSTWRPGVLARGSGAPRGTCIATFTPDGRYGNHTDGTSHAAILLEEQPDGLLVFDQWKGQPCHERVIRDKGGADPRWSNDASRFHVIETNHDPDRP
jgi:hypothetical protein